jgi:L-alanine-DL-glutamate epimerase-like enolase superfamily enzyme
MHITDYRLDKLEAPIGRTIGDSQVDPIEEFELVYLVLETDSGVEGVGLQRINLTGNHSVPFIGIEAAFETVFETLQGNSPFAIKNQMYRHRGGNYGSGRFAQLIDVALWDLCGKHLGTSVAELMGSNVGSMTDTVPAYASGLSYPNDDETTRVLYEEFADLGFTAAKVKVGYPTLAEDIERLTLVKDAFGSLDTLMIDANEAFSPKEAIRRCRAYEEVGFDIYWFEDPVLRDDIDGLRQVVDVLPNTHVNAGEYINLEGKRDLLERGAVDIVNLRGLSSGRAAARLATVYGRSLALGNTPGDIGIHLAAALPDMTYIEWSKPGWGKLLEDPVDFTDGRATVPEGPGHGLSISDRALEEYGVNR